MSVAEKIEQYLDQNSMYSFEGGSGVRNLTRLVEVLGYGGSFQDSLYEFLSDNSGAIQAVVEWIGSQHSDEWEEKLDEQLADPDNTEGWQIDDDQQDDWESDDLHE